MKQAFVPKRGCSLPFVWEPIDAESTEIRGPRMTSLKRFARLSPAEQRLLLQATFLVGSIRIGLWLLPFAVVRRIALRAGGKSTAAHPVNHLVWAVKAICRRLPGATCLTQAMAAQVLLARSGHHSRLQIGVAKDEQYGFQAHAWLITDGRILIGESEADRYTPIAAWETRL